MRLTFLYAAERSPVERVVLVAALAGLGPLSLLAPA
jgi:hypothetical protein